MALTTKEYEELVNSTSGYARDPGKQRNDGDRAGAPLHEVNSNHPMPEASGYGVCE